MLVFFIIISRESISLSYAKYKRKHLYSRRTVRFFPLVFKLVGWIGNFYSALTRGITALNVITLAAHQAHTLFLKPSQLTGKYTAQLLPFRRIGLLKYNNQLCPHRYPFTPGWRRNYGKVSCSRTKAPRSRSGFKPTFWKPDDLTIRTHIQQLADYLKPLGHGTLQQTRLLNRTWKYIYTVCQKKK